jgi:hypothetical protein
MVVLLAASRISSDPKLASNFQVLPEGTKPAFLALVAEAVNRKVALGGF